MNKTALYDGHKSILVTFLGVTKHFSVKNGPLRWGMLVEKQKHYEQGLAVTS